MTGGRKRVYRHAESNRRAQGGERKAAQQPSSTEEKYLPINCKGLFSDNLNGYRISYANFNLLKNCAIIKINTRSSLNYCKTSDLY